jgi:hypothetical protein
VPPGALDARVNEETAMATATPQKTGAADAQEKIQRLRDLFADAPALGKQALENVLSELQSQVSAPRAKVETGD